MANYCACAALGSVADQTAWEHTHGDMPYWGEDGDLPPSSGPAGDQWEYGLLFDADDGEVTYI